MTYNFKYDYLDLSQYVKKYGKTTLEVPENYSCKKEIFTGIGKVNVYTTKGGPQFVIKTESKIRNKDWTVRMTCPNSLSKYMRFHEQGKPSVYDIEYKNDKFIVTKKTSE